MQSSMAAQYRAQLVRLGGQKIMNERSNIYKPQHHSQTTTLSRQTMSDQQQQQQQQHSATLTYGPALAKLKLEADKIRKWKTATQFELKRKESQLTETKEAMEKAQEEVTRVRVREEALKTQLQDQLSSQTEIQHKILVTRGLWSTLKEKVDKIEATLDIGRDDHAHNQDLDHQRLEQYKALAEQYKELEREMERVQSSLKEALDNEREKGRGLGQELTNEIARSQNLSNELERLCQRMETISLENEETKRKLEEEEEMVERERKEKEEVEELYRQAQEQLRLSREESLSLQQDILRLNKQMSAEEAQYREREGQLEEKVKKRDVKCQIMEKELKESQSLVETQQSQMVVMVRERENLDISLTAIREELCAVEYSRRDDVARLKTEMREKEEDQTLKISHLSSQLLTAQSSLSSVQSQLREAEACSASRQQDIDQLTQSLTQQETVNVGLKTEIERLSEAVRETAREKEEREKERDVVQSNASSLSVQLDDIKTSMKEKEEKRAESIQQMNKEKSDVEEKLAETRRRLDEMEEERNTLMTELQRVRDSYQEEKARLEDEAERARETQAREKEGFDTQVTELCGMLERYRDENQKIVNQKDIQIQTVQQSLTQSKEKQEKLEVVVRQGQEEVTRLGEELARLQTDLGQREEEVRERESQVKEKDEEMAELLKAVDTLRKKQSSSSSVVQSTKRTPLRTPLRTPTLFSTPHTPRITPSTISHMAPPRSTPLSHRPPLKKPRQDEEEYEVDERNSQLEEDDERDMNRCKSVESEDVLFRKPHPLVRPPKSAETPKITKTPRSSGTLRSASQDYCSSSVGEVSSTASASASSSSSSASGARKRLSTTRSRGRKTGGGGGVREKGRGGVVGGGGKKKAAGTAWFDLDAVFGLGPED